MKSNNTLLLIRQLDKKLKDFRLLQNTIPVSEGWISLIRKTLRMSLKQLGKRMSITPQSVREIEQRERDGTITLKSLRDAGAALDMQFIYGFIPKDNSLEKMIELKAYEAAAKIVNRTSTTMKLEDQGNSNDRLKQAITELAEEIKREVPKSLWD